MWSVTIKLYHPVCVITTQFLYFSPQIKIFGWAYSVDDVYAEFKNQRKKEIFIF